MCGRRERVGAARLGVQSELSVSAEMESLEGGILFFQSSVMLPGRPNTVLQLRRPSGIQIDKTCTKARMKIIFEVRNSCKRRLKRKQEAYFVVGIIPSSFMPFCSTARVASYNLP